MRQLKITTNFAECTRDNCVTKYFNDIRHINPNYESDKDLTKEELIIRNLKFAVTVAKKYTSFKMPLEDLIQDANMGLIEAANRYDKSLNIRFISYAVWWMRRYILEDIKANANMIHISVALRSQINQALRKIEQIQQEYCQLLNLSNISNLTDEDTPHLLEAILSSEIVSINDKVNFDSNITFENNLHSESHTDQELLDKDLQQMIADAVSTLSEQEQYVIKRMFKDGAFKKTIAQEINRSGQGVINIRDRALKRLKEILEPQLAC